jgi:hypothetical protein
MSNIHALYCVKVLRPETFGPYLVYGKDYASGEFQKISNFRGLTAFINKYFVR